MFCTKLSKAAAKVCRDKGNCGGYWCKGAIAAGTVWKASPKVQPASPSVQPDAAQQGGAKPSKVAPAASAAAAAKVQHSDVEEVETWQAEDEAEEESSDEGAKANDEGFAAKQKKLEADKAC